MGLSGPLIVVVVVVGVGVVVVVVVVVGLVFCGLSPCYCSAQFM